MFIKLMMNITNNFIFCLSLCLLLLIFPSIRVFSNESVFASGGQSIGASASASVLPMNNQDWFPLGLAGLISLQSKRFSRVFSNTTVQKCQFLILSFLFSPTCDSADKESAFNTGDLGLIAELGRSPGGGHGNPLPYSCLENTMDRGVWWATVSGITKSQTQLSN